MWRIRRRWLTVQGRQIHFEGSATAHNSVDFVFFFAVDVHKLRLSQQSLGIPIGALVVGICVDESFELRESETGSALL